MRCPSRSPIWPDVVAAVLFGLLAGVVLVAVWLLIILVWVAFG